MTSQSDFLEALKSFIPDNKKLLQELQQALQLSKPAVYKRISGTTKLTFPEIMQICSYFDLSFDQITTGTKNITEGYPFFSNALKFKPNSLDEYWANILNHLDMVVSLPNLSTTYLTNEVPFFHYIQFPRLFCFKQYVWNRTSWNIPTPNTLYDKSFFESDSKVNNTIKELTKFYTSVDTTEIWNPDMLNITMMQLSYFVRSGAFKNTEDIKNIIDDLFALIRYLKAMADSGKKMFASGQRTDREVYIYLNELSINSEVIYIKSPKYRIVYNKYDAPNYLRSDDDRICDHIETWLDSIINLSSLISKRGQRERDLFFKNLNDQLEHFEQKVNGLIKAVY